MKVLRWSECRKTYGSGPGEFHAETRRTRRGIFFSVSPRLRVNHPLTCRAAPEVSVTGGGQELGVVAPKVVLPYRDLFDCVFGFFFSQPISKRKDQRPEPLGPSLPVFFGVFFIPMLRFSFQMIFNRIFSIALNPSSTSRFNTNALICA